MAKARFTASAEADLLDLWLYIAEDNPLAADNTVDSIQWVAKTAPWPAPTYIICSDMLADIDNYRRYGTSCST